MTQFACNELGGREGPRLKAIATLSPIPMFREWVVRTVEAHRRGDPGTTFLGSTSALEELLHRELWHTTQPTPQDEAMFWEILHKQVPRVSPPSLLRALSHCLYVCTAHRWLPA